MTEHGPDPDDETAEAPTAYERAMSRRWSRPPENLARETLLRHANPVELDGVKRPGLAGRIALLSKLGRGGMGVVYHGVHVRLGTEVAVKLLPLSVQAQGSDLVRRFEREAQIAARLASPHLVNVVDIDEDPGTGCHFIVMEFVDGPSGAGWASQHPGGTDEADALDLCIAATRGLEAAHVEGIVHRDVKPANILLPKDESGAVDLTCAKLADLGLARAEFGEQSLTGTFNAMGTPGYMSPEQAEDAKRAGKPADVFSMGATLYALLTGAAPFAGSSAAAAIANTMLGKYPPLVQARPSVSPATALLVDRCLRQNPAERYPDASALREALEYCRSLVQEQGVTEEQLDRLTVLAERTEIGRLVEHATGTQPPEAATLGAGPASPTGASPTPTPSATPSPSTTPGAASPTADAPGSTQPGSVGPAWLMGWRPRSIAAAVVALLVAVVVVSFLAGRGDGPVAPAPGVTRSDDPPAKPTPKSPATGPDAPNSSIDAPQATKPAATRPDDIEPDPATPPPPPPAAFATLEVDTRPSGASVVIDDEPVGTTPFRAERIEPGLRVIRFTHAGHEDREITVQIVAGLPTDLEVVILDAWGTVEAGDVDPDVTVLLDGKALTGRQYVSPEKEITVEFARPGYANQTLTTRVPLGKAARLVPPRPWSEFQAVLNFTGLDPGVVILVDGEEVSGPVTRPRDGKVHVTMTRPGYVTQEYDPEILLGTPRTIQPRPWQATSGSIDTSGLAADVQVEVDGQPYRSGAELPAGSHRVLLRRVGYRPQRRNVDVGGPTPVKLVAEAWQPPALTLPWRSGHRIAIETDVDQKLSLRRGGVEISSSDGDSEGRLAIEVASVAADGTASVLFRFHRLKGEFKGPAGKIEFDSESGKGPPSSIASAGRWFSADITAFGQVRNVSSRGFQWPRDAGGAFDEAQTAEMIRANLQAYLPRYDADDAAPERGSSWNTTERLFFAGAWFESSIDWSVIESDRKKIEFDLRGTVRSLSGVSDGNEGWTLQRFTTTGTMTIDRVTGFPTRSRFRSNVENVSDEDPLVTTTQTSQEDVKWQVR